MSAPFYTKTSPFLSASSAPSVPSTMTLPASSNNASDEKKSKKTTRCSHKSCGTKLGLLGFDCRCGAQFCGTHRFPDAHGCTHDFKKEAQVQLTRALEACVADKLGDRI